MSGFPVRCERGQADPQIGAGENKNFIVTAEDFNRLVSGIENTFPIETNLHYEHELHPFAIQLNYETYPKQHPLYDDPVAVSPVPKGYGDGVGKPDSVGGDKMYGKGIVTAKIHPGILINQDSASVGPHFYTESWLLSDLAVNRIKEEVKNGIFDSAPSKKDPDPITEPKTSYKTFIWEGSRLGMKSWTSYKPQLDLKGGFDSISLRSKPKPIPEVFAAMGCKSTESPSGKDRNLYSCDIMLNVKRPKADLEFELRPNALFAGESILGINSNYDVPPDSGQSSITSVAEYVPTTSGQSGGGLLSMLLALSEDDGLDKFVIARVYLVGPPAEWNLDEMHSGYPFTPFDTYFVRQYWRDNVCYGWRSPPRPIFDPNYGSYIPLLGLLGTLAGGIGFLPAAGILSANSTASELALAVFKAKKMEGAIWYV